MLTEIRTLLVETGRVWWRLFPQLLSIFLLGWLAAQVLSKVAVWVAEFNAWVALGLFALTFVCRLVAIVLILRLVGLELGIRDLLPAEERIVDDRETSLTHLLAVTLLPFLALYAAFGEVTARADVLHAEQMFRQGVFGPDTILGVLNTAATTRPLFLVGVVVGVYVVRRVLDAAHERTGWRLLGIAVAAVEGFFLVLITMGGIRLVQLAMIWIENRAVVGWLDQAREVLLAVLGQISAVFPVALTAAARFVVDEVWPMFWKTLSQPIIWLAVAALVYGSRVLSLAELWRKGQPYAARVPGATVFSSYRDKLALKSPGPPPSGVRRAAREFNTVFLGDINDKYLPTVHSIRLVLRAGVTFLACYVAAYTLIRVLGNLIETGVHLITGGHPVEFWFVFGPTLGLLPDVIIEPLRLCLLAVTFQRCLVLFQRRAIGASVAEAEAAPLTDPAPADPAGAGPATTEVGR